MEDHQLNVSSHLSQLIDNMFPKQLDKASKQKYLQYFMRILSS